jgi:hypothetical protein
MDTSRLNRSAAATVRLIASLVSLSNEDGLSELIAP